MFRFCYLFVTIVLISSCGADEKNSSTKSGPEGAIITRTKNYDHILIRDVQEAEQIEVVKTLAWELGDAIYEDSVGIGNVIPTRFGPLLANKQRIAFFKDDEWKVAKSETWKNLMNQWEDHIYLDIVHVGETKLMLGYEAGNIIYDFEKDSIVDKVDRLHLYHSNLLFDEKREVLYHLSYGFNLFYLDRIKGTSYERMTPFWVRKTTDDEKENFSDEPLKVTKERVSKVILTKANLTREPYTLQTFEDFYEYPSIIGLNHHRDCPAVLSDDGEVMFLNNHNIYVYSEERGWEIIGIHDPKGEEGFMVDYFKQNARHDNEVVHWILPGTSDKSVIVSSEKKNYLLDREKNEVSELKIPVDTYGMIRSPRDKAIFAVVEAEHDCSIINLWTSNGVIQLKIYQYKGYVRPGLKFDQKGNLWVNFGEELYKISHEEIQDIVYTKKYDMFLEDQSPEHDPINVN